MSHSVKGTKVYEMFKAHLKAHNFKFDPHDDDLVITLTVRGEDLPQPTVIRVPPNLWHCPINFKRVDKPVAFFPVYPDGDWSKVVRQKNEAGEYEYLFEAASLRRCVYDHEKICNYCGRCLSDPNVKPLGVFV